MMKPGLKFMSIALILPLLMAVLGEAVSAQTTTNSSHRSAARQHDGASAETKSQVSGGGTLGALPKWVGIKNTSFELGDSIISESAAGNIGIGTATPSSKLTVQGLIETTLGGVKFPDGTLQTTAGLAALIHDTTLKGNGSSGSPIGVALPLVLSAPIGGGERLLTVKTNGGVAIRAENQLGTGLEAISNSSPGVRATSSSSTGITAISVSSDAVLAIAGSGKALFALGVAQFIGDVQVFGNVSKFGGSFKIDHPLDPENKYLYHSFVESPDMMNIYNGNVTTDGNGEAIVTLPEWFEALNRDYRYQLTVIGQPAQAYIATEIKNGRFVINTNAPNVKVSWQVTGVRQDTWATNNRIPVEQEKPALERGTYLYPKGHGQPDEKSVGWALNPEQMKQRNELMEKTKKQ